MKTAIPLLITATLFLASCKKDEPVPPLNTTIYDKWHTDYIEAYNTFYRNGSGNNGDTTTVRYDYGDFWEFKNDGILYRNGPQINGQASFTLKGDSVIIQPGNLSANERRFRITQLANANLQLVAITVATDNPNYDSVKSTYIVNLLR